MPEPAQAPFQLLLETAARARSGSEGAESRLRVQPHWTGVGFALLGMRLVAPMREVAEILIVPPLTRLPRVKPWVRGVANVRGRLLPVIGLAELLGERASGNWRSHRALVVEVDDVYCGLVVDEVYGLEHFAADALRTEHDGVPAALAPFIDGAYTAVDGVWSLFRPSRLVSDERFLDAAR